jgi:glycosyltransferase involved in cell wall biosynthesis
MNNTLGYPLVSVILPSYNHSTYLKQRIDSILDQTYSNYELIILDDASPDASADIINSYKDDPRVSIEINQSNSGCVFKQWNKGLKKAKGELIWIAESDDYSDPSFLETLVSSLVANPNVGLAFCNSYRVVNEIASLAFQPFYGEFSYQYQSNFIRSGLSYINEQLAFCNTIPNASSVVFRKNLLAVTGFADESFLLSADWALWIKLLSISDLIYISKPLNFYRYHDLTARKKYSSNGVMIKEALMIQMTLKTITGITKSACKQATKRAINWYLISRLDSKNVLSTAIAHELDILAFQLSYPVRLKILLHRVGLLRYYNFFHSQLVSLLRSR